MSLINRLTLTSWIFLCTSLFAQDSGIKELISNGIFEEEIRYKALLDYEIDFNESKRFLNTEQLYECHATFAHYFREKGDYSRALMHALEALNCSKKLESLEKEGEIQLNITSIQLDVQNGEEAVKSGTDAVNIFETLNDTASLMDAYNNLANTYLATGQFVQGLKWYTKSLGIARILDSEEMAMVPIGNIGAYYLFVGEADSALIYIDQVLEFDRYNRNQANLAMAYGNKAYAYTLKQDYQLAQTYFDSSFAIANDKNLKVVQLNLYKDRSDMYYAQGKYSEAFSDLLQYQRINDSLKSSVSSEQIADWKVSFENEEKKRELILEKSKIAEEQHQEEIDDFKKKYLMTVVGLLVLLAAAVFWRFRTKSKMKKHNDGS